MIKARHSIHLRYSQSVTFTFTHLIYRGQQTTNQLLKLWSLNCHIMSGKVCNLPPVFEKLLIIGNSLSIDFLCQL